MHTELGLRSEFARVVGLARRNDVLAPHPHKSLRCSEFLAVTAVAN
jgi:hypothetical protein